MDTPDNLSDLNRYRIRVLIVDDDEGHAQAVADSLQRINCDCKVSSSSARAIELIQSENFDVVVTDLMMEEYDGLDILERTKKELPDAEVILLTGHGTINSAVAAMQGGAIPISPSRWISTNCEPRSKKPPRGCG